MPGNKNSLTVEQWQAVRLAFEAGQSINMLAKQYATQRNTIAAHRDRDGWRAPAVVVVPDKQSLKQRAAKIPGTRTRTAKQICRQSEVFRRSLLGQPIRTIAADLGISADTAYDDMRAESQARADEIGARLPTEQARSVLFYEHVIHQSLKRSDTAGRILESIATGADMKLTDRYLDTATKARERIDKVLGLEAAVRVDVGMVGLLAALEADVPQ